MSKIKRLRKSLVKSNQDISTTRTIKDLLLALGYSQALFDVVVITDGSGSSWPKPTGSAALVAVRHQEEILLHSSSSAGTNQTAELDAVCLAMRYLLSQNHHKQKKGCRVLVITDSLLVENTLKGIAEDPIKLYNNATYCDVVSGLLAMARRGFRYSVHRFSRNISPMHAAVDAASRAARLQQDVRSAYDVALQKTPQSNRRKNNAKERQHQSTEEARSKKRRTQ
jgi:ribonuclease HI